MRHKDKVKLARRIRTRQELLDRVPIFLTDAWVKRHDAIARRVQGKRSIMEKPVVGTYQVVKKEPGVIHNINDSLWQKFLRMMYNYIKRLFKI